MLSSGHGSAVKEMKAADFTVDMLVEQSNRQEEMKIHDAEAMNVERQAYLLRGNAYGDYQSEAADAENNQKVSLLSSGQHSNRGSPQSNLQVYKDNKL